MYCVILCMELSRRGKSVDTEVSGGPGLGEGWGVTADPTRSCIWGTWNGGPDARGVQASPCHTLPESPSPSSHLLPADTAGRALVGGPGVVTIRQSRASPAPPFPMLRMQQAHGGCGGNAH